MRYLLDTNVVSQYTKRPFNPAVRAWMQRTDDRELYLGEVTFAELWYGVHRLEHGARRAALQKWIEDDLRVKFLNRMVSFNLEVGRRYGFLMARAKMKGYSPNVMDTLIAATAETHGMIVATLNRVDFEQLGVEIVEF